MTAGRRGGGRARGWRSAGARTIVAAACVPAAAWLVGQAFADRWTWSQWLFWIPAWSMLLVSATAAVAALAFRAGPAAWRAAGAFVACTAVLAAVQTMRHEVGWGLALPDGEGTVSVTHWNPQWPGQAALEAGRALGPSLGDVTIITSPGSMLRGAVAEGWIPDGFEARDLGLVGIVSRWPVAAAQVIGSASVGPRAALWVAWVEVTLPGGRPLRLLALDLPSDPVRPRGEVAAARAALLGAMRLPAAPDVVVGDLNCTPGSVVYAALPTGPVAAPPWRASGWLATYARPFPLVRIDAMLADPAWKWARYETIDLGHGMHRAQRGILFVPPGTGDVTGVR